MCQTIAVFSPAIDLTTVLTRFHASLYFFGCPPYLYQYPLP